MECPEMLLFHPVLDRQSGYSHELGGVVRDDGHPIGQGDGGDHEVTAADLGAGTLEASAGAGCWQRRTRARRR